MVDGMLICGMFFGDNIYRVVLEVREGRNIKRFRYLFKINFFSKI